MESAVVVNGWTSFFFQPSQSIRLGCPLLRLLYVITIEVLSASIHTSPEIAGVQLRSLTEQFKCSGYADNTTIAAATDASIDETFLLKLQGGFSILTLQLLRRFFQPEQRTWESLFHLSCIFLRFPI